MSERLVRACDECGKQRGAVNNWWCVIESTTQPKFMSFDHADELTRQHTIKPETVRLDYCGQSCVGTAFNRWLDTGSVVRQDVKGV